MQTPTSGGPADAAPQLTSSQAGTNQQASGPSTAPSAQPQWTSSARGHSAGASQDWLGGADSGSASAAARTGSFDSGSRAGASPYAESSSRIQQVPLSSSPVPPLSTALQPSSGLGASGREKASDGSAADSVHPGTSNTSDESGTPPLPGIVGGVLGALAAIALLAYLVWRYWFKSGRSTLRRNGRGREGRSRILSVVSDPGTGKDGTHMAPTRGDWEKFGGSLGSPVPQAGALSDPDTMEKVPMDAFGSSSSSSAPDPHGQLRNALDTDGQLGTPVEASYLSFTSTNGLASPPVSASSRNGVFCVVPPFSSHIVQEHSSIRPPQLFSYTYTSSSAQPELETAPLRRGLFSHHFESHAPVPPPSMRSKRTSAAVTLASDSSHRHAHRNHGKPDGSPFGNDDDSDGNDADTIETGIHRLDSQTHLARAYYTASGERRPVSSTFSLGTVATSSGRFARTVQENEADAERTGAYEDLSRGNSLHAPSSRSPATSTPSSRSPSRAPSTRSRLAHGSLNHGKSRSARSSASYAANRRRQSLALPGRVPSSSDKVPEQGPSIPPSAAESLAPTPSLSRTSTITDISLGAVGRRSYIMGRAM